MPEGPHKRVRGRKIKKRRLEQVRHEFRKYKQRDKNERLTKRRQPRHNQ